MFILKSLYLVICYISSFNMIIVYNLDFYFNKKSYLYIFLEIISRLCNLIYIIIIYNFFYLY